MQNDNNKTNSKKLLFIQRKKLWTIMDKIEEIQWKEKKKQFKINRWNRVLRAGRQRFIKY